MKIYTKVILFAITSMLFTTCKKYPEGGWSNVAIKHLMGGIQENSSKTWHLKKYEVNGIDSTEFVKAGNGFTGFENDKIFFQRRDSKTNSLFARTNLYEYIIDFTDKKKSSFTVFTNLGPDKTQCNGTTCERNILNPVKSNFTIYEWKIIKLKKNEFIITSTKDNNYKIILTN